MQTIKLYVLYNLVELAAPGIRHIVLWNVIEHILNKSLNFC